MQVFFGSGKAFASVSTARNEFGPVSFVVVTVCDAALGWRATPGKSTPKKRRRRCALPAHSTWHFGVRGQGGATPLWAGAERRGKCAPKEKRRRRCALPAHSTWHFGMRGQGGSRDPALGGRGAPGKNFKPKAMNDSETAVLLYSTCYILRSHRKSAVAAALCRRTPHGIFARHPACRRITCAQ